MRVDLYPSRYFMGLLLLIHIAAMLIVLALPLAWWANVVIAIILFVSLIYHIKKYVNYQLAESVRALSTEDAVTWRLIQRNNEVLNAILLGDSIVTQYLLILNYKIQIADNKTKKRSVIIFSDAVDKQTFRRLRMFCLNKKG